MKSFFIFLFVIFFCCINFNNIYGNQINNNNNVDKKNVKETHFFQQRADDNGGVGCVVCTLLSQILIVKIESENSTVEQALESFCTYLPTPLNGACKNWVEQNGVNVIEAFLAYEAPDRICHALGACTNPQECVLYPSSVPIDRWHKNEKSSLLLEDTFGRNGFFAKNNFADVPGWLNWIVNRFGNDHLPLDDFDNDRFSPSWKTFRGRDWRGRDCNDFDHLAYPGIKPISGDKQFDSNCNGIYGIDQSSGKPYEEELCAVDQKGVLLAGDSVGAHFAFPCTFYFPGPDVYKKFFYFLANEGDFPYTSQITGFRNDTSGLLDPGRSHPLDSIYLRLLKRNRCVWNDFQNLAVNGADSTNSKEVFAALARNKERDRPVLFFNMLIGDDICDSKSLHWTTVENYRNAMQQRLDLLGEHLPKGSFVVNVGIIDGRVIYPVLHNSSYPFTPQPLQSKNNVASYSEWWQFMICTHTSVCAGWLNPNATVRNEATNHANLLNAQLKNLTLTNHYDNFEMTYYDFPFLEMGLKVKELGLPYTAMFEPFLGLHTTQVSASVMAEIFWGKLEKDFGESVLGSINPNNAKIDQLFAKNQNPYES